MDDKDEFQRDEKGDIIFPNDSKFTAEEMRRARWTYVFQFRDKDGFYHEVDYEKYAFEDMRTDLPKFNLIEYKLFHTELPASDEWFRYRNTCDYYVAKFFGPIFKRRLQQADLTKIDYFALTIPVELFKKIEEFIWEFKLTNYKDFIFYLIAKIEDVYLDDVEFYDRPEQGKKIKAFPKEVENLYKVLKWSEPEYSSNSNTKPELQQIVFHYNTVAPIKISDYLLTNTITKGAIKDLGEGSRKNWEKQLKAYPNVYDANQLPNEFRPRICKALHYFFREIEAFDFGKHETTDKEIEAIARILDFAHLKFRNKKGEDYDIESDLYDIKQNVKLVLKRKKLEYNPISLTAKDINTDFEKLKKYFDIDFLSYGEGAFSQEDILEVASITDRMGCNSIFPQLMYIFSCLKAKHFQLGHQFECCLNKEIERNEDYQAWKQILSITPTSGQLKEIRFKMEGDEKEYTLSEKLSIELLTRAFGEFYSKHRFEFETDFYESTVEHGKEPKSFRLVTTGKLHQPQNRFFSKFSKSCYQFLLNELPPDSTDWKPSEKYYQIIGLLLLKSYFLNHQMWDEEFVFQQVKYWYELS